MLITRPSPTCLAWVLFASQALLNAQSTALAVRAAAPDYSQEPFVVEQSRTTWRFENDGAGRRDLYMRVKVQNEAAVQAFGQLAFAYNAASERMDVVLARVMKSDGTIVTASADAVQDLSSAVQRDAPVYTDTREKHITVPGLRPGDVLELSLATIIHTPLARGQFWTEHDFTRAGIVLDEQLRIDVPVERQITVKTRPGFEPTISDRDGRRIYEWHSSRLTSKDAGGDAADGDRKPSAQPSKREPAAVRLTTFTSWRELGEWYADLERPQRMPTSDVRAKVIALTAGRTTDMDKLQALYEYVATNFRYVSLSFGVGRFQPHAAADVLHNEYGDCKDKHTLLASLAESIGLRASAALVNSSTPLDPDFPSPSQFDHVMTQVKVGAEKVWLDTTTEVAPFRLLAPGLRRKQALVVDAQRGAHLEESPAATPRPNTTTAEVDGALSESGTLTAKVRLTFSGDYELLMRTIFRRMSTADWKTMLDRVSGASGGGNISDMNVANPAALAEPFTLDYRITKPNFVTWTKKQFDLDLPLADMISIGPYDSGDADDSTIELGPERKETYKVRLALPAAFAAHAPVPVSLARDYADYRASYALDAHVFTAERALQFRQPELPSSRRSDYAAFARAVSADLDQSVAVETSVAPSLEGSAQLKAEELYNSGTDAVNNSRYTQAVMLLKRAVELQPAHKLAWTNLGRAYLGLHQTDAAIEAFKKQIDINPYDSYVYNNLGYAYRTQQNYVEAEAAFTKQLEIDPLNKFAYQSLGGLYLEQHKYEASAAALEKAIALSPKSASLQVRLGEALLNLGEHDRALAAFGRAVEIDPNPGIWNDIAYQLALKKTDLDMAQRYAESAIAAVTAATRTISLDHVTAREVAQAGSLAAYWDTLGWVYFAKGDTDRAENLVRASWNIVQHAEVGDHLGQIRERQGRRDEAIRAYALALTAERPDAGIRDRLARVAGADRVDEIVRKERDRLVEERTLALDVRAPAEGSADFFVLLDNTSSAPIEDVAFIAGDAALRPLTDALRKMTFDRPFPDAAPAKILRRGTASCTQSDRERSCRFVLMPPSDAQTAQDR